MSTAVAVAVAELVEATGHVCVRSGSGRGCHLLRWSRCLTCGWNSQPWGGNGPELLDLAHICDPADVARHQRIGSADG